MRFTPIILLLLAGAAMAEDEPTVLERLKSEAAAERAWGAYLAGKDGVADAVPLLIDVIRTVPDHKDNEGRLVVRAAFDALIRLEASVRAKVLEPHLRSYFGTPALILLTRSPEVPPELLLSLFDRHGKGILGRHGIAIGNLLCKNRTPGFASRLLRQIKAFQLHVHIVEEGFGGSGGSGSLGVGFGDGRIDVPEGFPPTVIYILTDKPRPGSVMLADGPRPIRWYRTERTGRRIGFGSSGLRIHLDHLAREWLAVLAGLPVKKRMLPKSNSTSLVWTDEKAYVKKVAADRDTILARYWKLVATLVTKEAIALDEARILKPSVEIEIHDKRKEPPGTKFPKLPAPPKRPLLPGEAPEER